MSTNDEVEILCPTKHRRTSLELHVKFVVILFTVGLNYTQWLRLRREPIVFARVLLFILAPSITLGYLISSLVAIIVPLFSTGENTAHIADTFGILFGEFVIADNAANNAGVSDSSPAVLDGDAEQTDMSKQSLTVRLYGTFRPLLLQLALMGQYTTTFYLYARRVEQSAVLLYDIQILCLAVGGFCTSILRTVALLEPVILPEPRYYPFKEKSLFWIKQIRYGVFGHEKPKPRHLLLPVMVVLGSYYGIINFWLFGFGISPEFNMGMGVAFIFILSISDLGSRESLPAYSHTHRSFRRVIEMMLLLFIWLYLYLSTDNLSALKDLPPYKPCPGAWSDPKSKWVWWFA